MGFMQKQVTVKLDWYQIETNCGTWFVPTADVGKISDVQDSREVLSEYCEGVVESFEIISGYGARLSAPGYLDCTEWAVFPTEAGAEAYLDENYPDDEDESEDEDH